MKGCLLKGSGGQSWLAQRVLRGAIKISFPTAMVRIMNGSCSRHTIWTVHGRAIATNSNQVPLAMAHHPSWQMPYSTVHCPMRHSTVSVLYMEKSKMDLMMMGPSLWYPPGFQNQSCSPMYIYVLARLCQPRARHHQSLETISQLVIQGYPGMLDFSCWT